MDNDSSWCWAAHAWQRLDQNLTLMVWEDHGIETNRWMAYIDIFIDVYNYIICIYLYVHLASYCFAWTCCYSVFEAYIYICHMYRRMLLAILALPFAVGNSWKLSAILI